MNFLLNLHFAMKMVVIVCITLDETTGYSSFKPELKLDESDERLERINSGIECGVSPGNKVQLNGVEITTYPWFVLLEYNSTGSSRQIRCAGVIIDDRNILTSALCATESLVSVRFGEWTPNCTKDDHFLYSCVNPAETAEISWGQIHRTPSQYDGLYKKNNVAVLRLAKRLEFNEFVRPICLATRENGFDSLQQFFYPQWNLQLNQLSSESFIKRTSVVDIDVCNEAYGSNLSPYKKNLICVNPGCALPGGPLVHVEFGENDMRKSYVVAVGNFVARPTQCQLSGERASVYKKVSIFDGLIQGHTRGH